MKSFLSYWNRKNVLLRLCFCHHAARYVTMLLGHLDNTEEKTTNLHFLLIEKRQCV